MENQSRLSTKDLIRYGIIASTIATVGGLSEVTSAADASTSENTHIHLNSNNHPGSWDLFDYQTTPEPTPIAEAVEGEKQVKSVLQYSTEEFTAFIEQSTSLNDDDKKSLESILTNAKELKDYVVSEPWEGITDKEAENTLQTQFQIMQIADGTIVVNSFLSNTTDLHTANKNFQPESILTVYQDGDSFTVDAFEKTNKASNFTFVPTTESGKVALIEQISGSALSVGVISPEGVSLKPIVSGNTNDQQSTQLAVFPASEFKNAHFDALFDKGNPQDNGSSTLLVSVDGGNIQLIENGETIDVKKMTGAWLDFHDVRPVPFGFIQSTRHEKKEDDINGYISGVYTGYDLVEKEIPDTFNPGEVIKVTYVRMSFLVPDPKTGDVIPVRVNNRLHDGAVSIAVSNDGKNNYKITNTVEDSIDQFKLGDHVIIETRIPYTKDDLLALYPKCAEDPRCVVAVSEYDFYKNSSDSLQKIFESGTFSQKILSSDNYFDIVDSYSFIKN